MSLILNESLKTIRYTLTGTQKDISRFLSTNTSREESETPIHMDSNVTTPALAGTHLPSNKSNFRLAVVTSFNLVFYA